MQQRSSFCTPSSSDPSHLVFPPDDFVAFPISIAELTPRMKLFVQFFGTDGSAWASGWIPMWETRLLPPSSSNQQHSHHIFPKIIPQSNPSPDFQYVLSIHSSAQKLSLHPQSDSQSSQESSSNYHNLELQVFKAAATQNSQQSLEWLRKRTSAALQQVANWYREEDYINQLSSCQRDQREKPLFHWLHFQLHPVLNLSNNHTVIYKDPHVKLKAFTDIKIHSTDEILWHRTVSAIPNCIFDNNENPAEDMHSLINQLQFMEKKNYADPTTLRPNTEEKNCIDKVINQTALQKINEREALLLWKYRYFLVDYDAKSLIKFLESPQRDSDRTRVEAYHILRLWKKVDLQQCLLLLSDKFREDDILRSFAVDSLKKFEDDQELINVLPQLVQSLRYERTIKKSKLVKFLYYQASKSFTFANYLYWYLNVETFGSQSSAYNAVFNQLAEYLEERAPSIRQYLRRQQRLVNQLQSLASTVQRHKDPEESSRILLEYIRGIPNNKQWNGIFFEDDPLPLPINPQILAVGINPDYGSVFKSNARPFAFEFITNTGSYYKVMYKIGDDLRRDMLVLQTVRFVDRSLKENNFDVGLTPYNVLAINPNEGLIEIIPASKSLEELSKQRKLKDYLTESLPESISIETVLENYLRSTAGYTIISHVLGIGDRHLGNILMKKNGRLFHIDFGFILGKAPKKWASPIKLNSYMLDFMGGANSENYLRFMRYSCVAYLIIRRVHHDLINMFYLMVDAGIEGVSKQSITHIQNCLALDSDVEMAEKDMYQTIVENTDSFKGRAEDFIHNLGQYLRSQFPRLLS